MTMATTTNPSFDLPRDDDGSSDTELWILRAPAALDVSALLDGVALDVDPRSLTTDPASTSNNNANILSTFQSEDSEYALTLIGGDAKELDDLRLLVPKSNDDESDDSSSDGNDDDELLIPCGRPFVRQIQLTSVFTGRSGGDEEFVIAPSEDAAPTPALDQTGNGSVDAVRLAYVPVAQRRGLKRRWAMPGNMIKGEASSPSAIYKKEAIVSDDDHQTPTAKEDEQRPKKAARSSSKKDKKNKEKKSRKSPKK